MGMWAARLFKGGTQKMASDVPFSSPGHQKRGIKKDMPMCQTSTEEMVGFALPGVSMTLKKWGDYPK